MADFERPASSATVAADSAAAVTPSDGADLAFTCYALIIGAAGTIKVTMRGGQVVTMTVPVGLIPIRVSRVWATGTTATGITALW